MGNNLELLFSVLKVAIKDNSQFNIEFDSITNEKWKLLYKLSVKQDIAALVSFGLEKVGFLNENNPLFKSFNDETVKALYRYEMQNYDLEWLIEALEVNKIPFIPLKGAEIRKLYYKPYLRTSSDIDILIEKKFLDEIEVLLTKNGYKKTAQNAHEQSFISPSGTNVEFHYELIEKGWAKDANKILNNPFKNAEKCEGYDYKMKLHSDIFYFYHVAHIAKHFEEGGCGVRPFIDLYLLDKKIPPSARIDELLDGGGLLKFYKVIKAVNGMWFDGLEKNDFLSEVTRFVFSGGVYGSAEKMALITQQKKGGKGRYIFFKIFPPYESLKYVFPIIQKHKWLTPFMYVARWFKLIFKGRAKNSVKEIKYTASITSEETKEIKDFFENIGL